YCMNVTYPLVPDEMVAFCAGKQAVLMIEEGQPAYIEDALLATLRRHDVNSVRVHGKDLLPLAGEYTGEVVLSGVAAFLESAGIGTSGAAGQLLSAKKLAAELLGGAVPARPPGFCVGCPERPVFAAMRIAGDRKSGV